VRKDEGALQIPAPTMARKRSLARGRDQAAIVRWMAWKGPAPAWRPASIVVRTAAA